MKKFIFKFVEKILIPLMTLILLLCLSAILKPRENSLMHNIIIAMCSCSLLSVLVGCISYIKWIIKFYKTKNRLNNFKTNEDGSYTCPVCQMDNIDISPCERCGFNPSTMGNVSNETNDKNIFI